MCQFFSLCSDGNGKVYYFNWQQRKDILAGKIKVASADSHTSIAAFYEFKGAKEDTLNKYEYNPLTKVFTVDVMNTTDDSKQVEHDVNAWDFKTIIEPLIIKPIIYPFKDKKAKKVTKADIKLLKQWASMWASVGDSVWDSVRDSVGASVWDSVRASMGASMGASVRASVGAYESSFVKAKYKHDFSCAVKLWEMGLVPSYHDETWRLHGGPDGKVLWEGKLKARG